MNLKQTALCVAYLAAIYLPGAESNSPFVISDDRVRSLDLSPVLGRGYSIMTNTFQSTCLIVDETTVPSFNYDYFYTDFTKTTDKETEMGGKISGSLSYGMVSGEFSAEASSTSKVSTKTQMIATTMKIERYYSSVKEEVSPLAADAFTLLESEDYVGFFKACGPNYVRSLRRAQEVTAVFKFQSSSKETSKEFASSLKVSTPYGGGAGEASGKSKFNSINSSLEIKIQGFGMGLSQEGSETMVATNLEEFQNVMKFAFKTMTQNEDAYNIGMVYGMEVVPWVNNLAFQVAAKVADQNILVPVPRSVIPMAFKKTDHSDTSGFSETSRDDYRCKDDTPDLFKIDKYGFCCEAEQLYDPVNDVYPEPATACDLTVCVCKPVYNLDKALVKDNMANNGEFVARLDNAMRYKLAQLGTLEKCITASRAIPEKYHYHILKSNDSVKYDKEIQTTVAVIQLRKAVDPLDDYGLLKHMGRELDEWIEMYYSPCLAALYGMNVGASPNPDVSYFMAYPWHTYSECMMLTCVMNNMRWNRETGAGCLPSLITGYEAELYSDDDDDNKYCARDGDRYGDAEVCKHNSTDLQTFQSDIRNCWNHTQMIQGIDHLLNHFCNPQITANKVDDDEKTRLEGVITTYCT